MATAFLSLATEKIEKQFSNITHINKMANMDKVAKSLKNCQFDKRKDLDVKKKGWLFLGVKKNARIRDGQF